MVTPQHQYSEESIALLKQQKREEIRKSQERISAMINEVLSPKETYEKADKISTYIQTGIAVYDGIRMGSKLLSRIRKAFKNNSL